MVQNSLTQQPGRVTMIEEAVKSSEWILFSDAVLEIFNNHSNAIKGVELVTELAAKNLDYIAKFFDLEHDQEALKSLDIAKIEYHAQGKDKTLYVRELSRVSFSDGETFYQ